MRRVRPTDDCRVDAAAAVRTDLVAIGSGPGERTVGGAVFARRRQLAAIVVIEVGRCQFASSLEVGVVGVFFPDPPTA